MENTETKTTVTTMFSTFLKEKRTALDLTQKEMALKIFEDEEKHRWIGDIERGRGITLATMSKILENLDCTITIHEN